LVEYGAVVAGTTTAYAIGGAILFAGEDTIRTRHQLLDQRANCEVTMATGGNSDSSSAQARRRYIWTVWVCELGLPGAAVCAILNIVWQGGDVRALMHLSTITDVLVAMLLIVPLAYLVGSIFWSLGLDKSHHD
jgi:hypothetical protein